MSKTKFFSLPRAALLVALVLVAMLAPSVKAQECDDPAAAVAATMSCIEMQDAECAAAGYDLEGTINKVHNGGEPEIIDRTAAWWQGFFPIATQTIDIQEQENVGPNQASITYTETIKLTDGSTLGLTPSTEYPFGAVFVQQEAAIVSVNSDCKITYWNQTGDDDEQALVEKGFADLLAEPSVACVINGGTSCDGSNTSAPTTEPTTAGSLSMELYAIDLLLPIVACLSFFM